MNDKRTEKWFIIIEAYFVGGCTNGKERCIGFIQNASGYWIY